MKIERTIDIAAPREDVFDLISRVEAFENYSSIIKKISKIGLKSYRWKIQFAGVDLEWDSEIAEYEKPRRFAWSSVGGLKNSGSYDLEATDNGTRVHFTMECDPPVHVLERLTSFLIGSLMDSIAKELLDNVKAVLEGKGGS